jgi:hypothetical protein
VARLYDNDATGERTLDALQIKMTTTSLPRPNFVRRPRRVIYVDFGMSARFAD